MKHIREGNMLRLTVEKEFGDGGDRATEFTLDSYCNPPTTVGGRSRNITLRIDYNGDSVDKGYELEENVPVIIGRGSDANIPLNKDDLQASRNHGEFVYREDKIYYKDTSTGGTMADGTRLYRQEVEVKSGMMLIMGTHRVKVQM